VGHDDIGGTGYGTIAAQMVVLGTASEDNIRGLALRNSFPGRITCVTQGKLGRSSTFVKQVG
jgi:hypothetical protein